ncbi:MAG: hypothetical protein AABO57_25255 [Acidobacteriota bacterium]
MAVVPPEILGSTGESYEIGWILSKTGIDSKTTSTTLVKGGVSAQIGRISVIRGLWALAM